MENSKKVDYKMQSRVNLIVFLVVLVLGCISNVQADNDDEASTVATFNGLPVTGPNSFLGEHPIDFGVILGLPYGTIGFGELAEYDPNSDKPKLITPDTDMSAVLATYIGLDYLETFGLNGDAIDSEYINVPLHDVQVLVSGDGVTRETLPEILDSDPLDNSVTVPNAPITLGDWLTARGTTKIKCKDDGTSKLTIKTKNLIANKLYTVWGLVILSDGSAYPHAVGGLPNAFMSDDKGSGLFERQLNYCPLGIIEVRPGVLGRLFSLDVVYHSDHSIYATVPTPSDALGLKADKGLKNLNLFGGLIAHAHIEFPLLGNLVTSNSTYPIVKDLLSNKNSDDEEDDD